MKTSAFTKLLLATSLMGASALCAAETLSDVQKHVQSAHDNIQKLSDNDAALAKRLSETTKELEELKLFKMKAEALLEALKYNDEKTHQQYLKTMDSVSNKGIKMDDSLVKQIQSNTARLNTINDDMDVVFEKLLDLKKIARSGAEAQKIAKANASRLNTINDDVDVLFEKMLDLKKNAGKGGGGLEMAKANASKLNTMNDDIDVLFEKMLDLKKNAGKGGGGDSALAQANASKLKTMNDDIDVLFEKMLDMKKNAGKGGDSALAKTNASKLQTMNDDIDVLFEKMLDLKKSKGAGSGESELAKTNASKLNTMNDDIDVLFEKMLDMKKSMQQAQASSDKQIKAFEKKQPTETTNAPEGDAYSKLNEQIKASLKIATDNQSNIKTLNDDIDVLFEKMMEIKKSIQDLAKK